MYLVAALVLVLVIALVIKPIATGQPLKTGIPTSTTPLPLSAAEIITTYQIPISETFTIIPSTSMPTWNPNSPKDISFVDNASKYGVSFDQQIMHGTQFNESYSDDRNRTTIAVISKIRDTKNIQLSGATEIMYIPFPYWEMVYTITPSKELKPATTMITPSLGQGVSYSGISSSYSTLAPQFTIQVMDGDDPNRIVRTITPPGGINLDLWKGVVPTTQAAGVDTIDAVGYGAAGRNFKSNQLTTVVATPTPVDPRPWTEKFYEGQRNYYFIITAQAIDSYKIEIKVPSRYIGKY